MATFGGIRDDPDAAARALACALALRVEMGRWSDKRRASGSGPISLAIGVHFGAVMVGNLGSGPRIEFTALGDVVNVASRLEKLTREMDRTLIVSEACVRAAGAAFASRTFLEGAQVRLRGREAPLRVYVD